MTSQTPRVPVVFAALGLSAAILLNAAGTARSSETDVFSFTAAHSYSREAPTGDHLAYAPLFERLSLDAWEILTPAISAHANAWWRLELGEEGPDGGATGWVESAYLAYHGRGADAHARLGRFLLAEGTLTETVDGVFVKAKGRLGIGAALFAGTPVQDAEVPPDGVVHLTGGRLFYASPSLVEGGVTFLRGQGLLADGEDRRELGADLWLRPVRSLTVGGEGVYNQVRSTTARTRASATLSPTDSVAFSLGAESYAYDSLFDAALNPAFSSSALGAGDEVDVISATVEWRATDRLALVAEGRRIDHLLDDPGDATRVELQIGMGHSPDLGGGVSAARLSADRRECSYSEVRGYVTVPSGPWRLALDALAQTLDEALGGEDRTIQVVGSAGRSLGRSMRMSVDARYTSSPTFEEDLALVVRFETWTGKDR